MPRKKKNPLRYKYVVGVRAKDKMVKSLHTAFDKGKLSSFSWKKVKTSGGKKTDLWIFEIKKKLKRKKK